MTRLRLTGFAILLLACGGTQPSGTEPIGKKTSSSGGETHGTASSSSGAEGDTPPKRKTNDAGEFQIDDRDKSSRPEQAKLKPTATEAAVRFFVVDKDDGPVKGIVISLTSPTGEKYYAEETGADGFTEILLPIGKTYKLVYVSLGRRDIEAKVKVANQPRLNLRLTLRYKREKYPIGLILDEINFATGRALLTNESKRRLNSVVEFMKYKKSARIEISGHTDNVGNKRANKKLSQQRADAVRDYIVSQQIDPTRIQAVGYGDAKPIAPNDTEEGRERNRRIEAKEL